MTELQIRGARKAYGPTMALRRGDFDLEGGEVHVLIGSNGSGKSTLCKIVSGSVRPDDGEILIDGKPVSIDGPRAAKALGIATFYQELSLAARRTVAENISLAHMPVSGGVFVDRPAVEKRARDHIARFQDVAGEGFGPDVPVARLREDQRQLVEIMKTLASDARIMIFDEPTSSLDRAQVERFFEILRELKAEDRAVVFISHRMDEIFAIGDRVTVIRDGETVTTAQIAETEPAAIIRHMVGEQAGPAAASAARPAEGDAAAERVLSVKDFSGDGFSGVSLEVRRGEILGFGGLHGQGQSAVLRALFGALPHSGGSVALNGEALTLRSPRAAIRKGIAYVSGDRGRDGIVHGRPILENLTPIHFLRNRLHLARPAQLRERVLPALEALKTRFHSLDQPVGALSGGNQQKIVIARWLVDRPMVLLLDDPTKGIDLNAKADLFALIGQLAEEGLAIILYSSEDAELLNNAGRILVFNGGSVSRALEGAHRTRYNLYQAAFEAA